MLKTLDEKAATFVSDPYLPQSDMEPPIHWPIVERLSNGELFDPVKRAVVELQFLNLLFQDYEIDGTLLKLGLRRPEEFGTSYLSQMSYLLSLTDKNIHLQHLIAKPSFADLNHPCLWMYIKEIPSHLRALW
jgi:hypothetical protein